MTKKKKKSTDGLADFLRETRQAVQDGYVFMPVNEYIGDRVNASTPGWEDVLNVTLYGSDDTGKPRMAGNGCGIFASSGNEVFVSDKVGTPGRGFIEWGSGNRLPNVIALLTSLLPYTAAGAKFNTDTAAGLGPQPKYRYSHYVAGSGVQTEEVDFRAAGQLIEGQIEEARRKLAAHYKACREAGIGLDAPDAVGAGENETRINKQIEERMLKVIADYEQAYEDWERTDGELRDFLTRNNLGLILLQLFEDMIMFGICFPEIQLSRETLTKDTALWQPRATGLSYRSAHTCRLERMDDDNRIRYVYVSNRWLDQTLVPQTITDDVTAIRALDPEQPVTDLERQVRRTRQKGKKVKVADRPTRFILPSSYPSVGRPYYPQPAWHSVFGGDIYPYISTIISDRFTRKKNGNSFGRILYIHTEYLVKLAMQMNLKTNEEKEALKDHIVSKVNSFFANETNNGKPLLSATFTGNDGKDRDAFRIVELPYNSKSVTDANKTELEELASIIFFSMGIWPELVGAIPGKSGSVGGTYLREMYLLKQLMMAPTQRIVLQALETIGHFNKWDSHLTWSIKQMTLTTLDRNKNGMEETKA